MTSYFLNKILLFVYINLLYNVQIKFIWGSINWIVGKKQCETFEKVHNTWYTEIDQIFQSRIKQDLRTFRETPDNLLENVFFQVYGSQ